MAKIMTTAATPIRAKTWIVSMGLVSATLALVLGIWNFANLTGTEDSSPVLVLHHAGGKVAGVTTDESGTVRLTVNDGKSQRAYLVDVSEPLSVYNLFRLAQSTTLFRFDYSTTLGSPARLTTVDGVQATAKSQWHISVNGVSSSSPDGTTVKAGDEIIVSLKP